MMRPPAEIAQQVGIPDEIPFIRRALPHPIGKIRG
jgi:hypothetical protein